MISASLNLFERRDAHIHAYAAESEQQNCSNSTWKLARDLKVGPLDCARSALHTETYSTSFLAHYRCKFSNTQQHLVDKGLARIVYFIFLNLISNHGVHFWSLPTRLQAYFFRTVVYCSRTANTWLGSWPSIKVDNATKNTHVDVFFDVDSKFAIRNTTAARNLQTAFENLFSFLPPEGSFFASSEGEIWTSWPQKCNIRI